MWWKEAENRVNLQKLSHKAMHKELHRKLNMRHLYVKN